MTITYHNNIEQGTDEWLAIRCGRLTASEMKLIITPSNLKPASNDKERAHLYELVAQRITGYVEPQYVSDDMLRGMVDEIDARAIYAEKHAPVTEMGFITNDKWGFTLGCSPDGIVGDDGQLECKSRRQKYQVETIIKGTMPDDYLIQVQTALLVSERKWCDFISYSAGLPLVVIRIYPDPVVQEAIINAAAVFEGKAKEMMTEYAAKSVGMIMTERKVTNEGDMY